jgi:hypothetical protein
MREMKSLDGKHIDNDDNKCDGEDLERIVITDREAVFDFITHLENPLRYVSFRNLKELVEKELPHMFYERRYMTRPIRRLKICRRIRPGDIRNIKGG